MMPKMKKYSKWGEVDERITIVLDGRLVWTRVWTYEEEGKRIELAKFRFQEDAVLFAKAYVARCDEQGYAVDGILVED